MFTDDLLNLFNIKMDIFNMPNNKAIFLDSKTMHMLNLSG
jgi:hypothetical protein